MQSRFSRRSLLQAGAVAVGSTALAAVSPVSGIGGRSGPQARYGGQYLLYSSTRNGPVLMGPLASVSGCYLTGQVVEEDTETVSVVPPTAFGSETYTRAYRSVVSVAA